MCILGERDETVGMACVCHHDYSPFFFLLLSSICFSSLHPLPPTPLPFPHVPSLLPFCSLAVYLRVLSEPCSACSRPSSLIASIHPLSSLSSPASFISTSSCSRLSLWASSSPPPHPPFSQFSFFSLLPIEHFASLTVSSWASSTSALRMRTPDRFGERATGPVADGLAVQNTARRPTASRMFFLRVSLRVSSSFSFKWPFLLQTRG